MEIQQPNSALKRLDKLVGTWQITGRTLDSDVDNITGQVTIEWILEGFFMQQTGTIEMVGMKVKSIEIVGYDPSTDTFPALVYGNMGSVPLSYNWDIQGNTVTHWTKGSKYTGHFSENGNILAGGWRPDETEQSSGFAYDATMTKIK